MEVMEQVFQLVLTILTPIVSILAGYVAIKVKAYIDEKVQNDEVNSWLTMAIKTLEDAVNIVAQRYTSELKDKQGSLTKEQQIKAFEMAKEYFEQEMGEGAKAIIEAVYGDYSTWLDNQIDSILGKSKK